METDYVVEVTIQSFRNLNNAMLAHCNDLVDLESKLAAKHNLDAWGAITRSGVRRRIPSRKNPTTKELLTILDSYFNEARDFIKGDCSVRLQVFDSKGMVLEILELGYAPKSM